MSGDSAFQKQARNIFKVGISLFQQVAQQQRNDSSDDEGNEVEENDDFINNGQRGIVVYKTYSVKSDRQKIMHINLYKAQVVQYYESKKRTYHCEEFVSISRNADNNVLIEIKKPMSIQSQYKKIILETDQLAHQFHQYIEFINESGKSTKMAFNQIDYRRTGVISCPDLRKALARVDLTASEQDIINMMAMGTGKDGAFDYVDFVHLFFNSFVSNLRQCLQEWLIQATASATDSATSLSKVDTSLDALPGEVIAFAPTERVYWCIFGGKHCKHPQHIPGVMYATNYRIVLFALRKATFEKNSHTRFDVPSFFNMISIPLTTLQRIYFAAPRNSIYLVCKDFRIVRITLSGFENSKNKVETFVQVLQGISFYNVHSLDPKTHLFAYKNLTYFSNSEQGWNLCDLIKEYVRQGLFDSPDWKVLENKEYSLADTYPRYLCLPARMTKDEIRIAAGFRSKSRLPVVTYLHKATGAVLTRSAQPMVGLAQKNCPEDEKLLNLYRCKGRVLEPKCEEDQFSRFCILDARGKVAATLNMAVGKGTEDVSLYQNTELIFCNIDNIHVMRTSAAAMADALSASVAYTQDGKDQESQLLMEGSQAGFFSKIEESGWMRHTRLIMLSSVVAAEKLHFEGTSVLVHCSDGWDRTAQICGVAQILLDPFFRTIEGFATLVEKEWCAFGHKFQDRCGHGQDHTNLSDERSPVFLQFLDVLYQLLVQFPTAFEFSESLLLFLADHLHSCLFGNFLGNSEKERMDTYEARLLTRSIWSYVFGRRQLFVNTEYTAFEKPLWPSCGAASVRVWSRFWQRWDMTAHPNHLEDVHWHDNWGNGAETDPSHVVKRSSYSYVSKAPAKRPLGVRGLVPTHSSGSSLNSQHVPEDAGSASPMRGAGGADTTDQQQQVEGEGGAPSDSCEEHSAVEDAQNGTEREDESAMVDNNYAAASSGNSAGASRPARASFVKHSATGSGSDAATADFVTSACIEDALASKMLTLDAIDGLPASTHSNPEDGLLDELLEDAEGSELPFSEAFTGPNEESFAHDDDEEFHVLTDRATVGSEDLRREHRKVRINRSIEGNMLQFNERYDSPEVDTQLRKQHPQTSVVSDADTNTADSAIVEQQEIPYSYPPSGKDVAFI